MSIKTCAEPGCPDLTTAIYCDQHRKDKRAQADSRRLTSTQRGYNARWRQTRRAFLRAHPICQCDDQACRRIATIVHHRDGKGPTGPQGHNPSNLQALAKQCHDQLTATQQPGGWHQKVG